MGRGRGRGSGYQNYHYGGYQRGRWEGAGGSNNSSNYGGFGRGRGRVGGSFRGRFVDDEHHQVGNNDQPYQNGENTTNQYGSLVASNLGDPNSNQPGENPNGFRYTQTTGCYANPYGDQMFRGSADAGDAAGLVAPMEQVMRASDKQIEMHESEALQGQATVLQHAFSLDVNGNIVLPRSRSASVSSRASHVSKNLENSTANRVQNAEVLRVDAISMDDGQYLKDPDFGKSDNILQMSRAEENFMGSRRSRSISVNVDYSRGDADRFVLDPCLRSFSSARSVADEKRFDCTGEQLALRVPSHTSITRDLAAEQFTESQIQRSTSSTGIASAVGNVLATEQVTLEREGQGFTTNNDEPNHIIAAGNDPQTLEMCMNCEEPLIGHVDQRPASRQSITLNTVNQQFLDQRSRSTSSQSRQSATSCAPAFPCQEQNFVINESLRAAEAERNSAFSVLTGPTAVKSTAGRARELSSKSNNETAWIRDRGRLDDQVLRAKSCQNMVCQSGFCGGNGHEVKDFRGVPTYAVFSIAPNGQRKVDDAPNGPCEVDDTGSHKTCLYAQVWNDQRVRSLSSRSAYVQRPKDDNGASSRARSVQNFAEAIESRCVAPEDVQRKVNTSNGSTGSSLVEHAEKNCYSTEICLTGQQMNEGRSVKSCGSEIRLDSSAGSRVLNTSRASTCRSSLSQRRNISLEEVVIMDQATSCSEGNRRQKTPSGSSQQSHVSFATFPTLSDHPDDVFSDNPEAPEVRYRPTCEQVPTPGRGLDDACYGKVDSRGVNEVRIPSDGPVNANSCRTPTLQTDGHMVSNDGYAVHSLTADDSGRKMPEDQILMMRDSGQLPSMSSKTQYSREEFERRRSLASMRRLIDFGNATELACSTPPCAAANITKPNGAQNLGENNHQTGPTLESAVRVSGRLREYGFSSWNDSLKEQIVTQSPENMNRAAAMVESVLQQRLNHSGSQSNSFTSTKANCSLTLNNNNNSVGAQKWPVGKQHENHVVSGSHLMKKQPVVSNNGTPLRAFPAVVNKICHSTSPPKVHLTSHGNPNVIEEVDRAGLKGGRKMSSEEGTGLVPSRMNDDKSTIRKRLPKGQTRKLASIFESMAEEAKKEMSRNNPPVRGKSVPPNAARNKVKDDFLRMGKSPRDDSFIGGRGFLGGKGDAEMQLEKKTATKMSNDEKALRYGYTSGSPHLFSVQNVEAAESPRFRHFPEQPTFVNDRGEPKSMSLHGSYVSYTPKRTLSNEQRFSTPLEQHQREKRNFGDQFFDGGRNSCERRPSEIMCEDEVDLLRKKKAFTCEGVPLSDEDAASFAHNRKSHPRRSYDHGDWNHEQYELGRQLGEGFSRVQSYLENLQAHQAANKSKESVDNNNFESQEGQEIGLDGQCKVESTTSEGEIRKEDECDISCAECAKNDAEELDYDAVDHGDKVVDEAFDFVNQAETVYRIDSKYSQVRSYPVPNLQTGFSASNYTAYSKDEDKHRRSSPVGDVPITFSPVMYQSPPAGERIATYKQGIGVEECDLRDASVKGDPMATSTPNRGSPQSIGRINNNNEERIMMNRSGVSSISASTAETRDDREFNYQTQKLQESIAILEEQISQATAALAYCRKHNTSNGTLKELSAQRVLLLARERQTVLSREMQRLKTMQLIKKPLPSLARRMRGTMDIDSIVIYLNRNFCIRNSDEHDSYAFLILLKSGEQVEGTQTVTVMDTRPMRISTVHFSDHIRFYNLPVEFRIMLEIYAMKIREIKRPDDLSCTTLRSKAKSLLTPSRKASLNESAVSSTEFTRCGCLCLGRDTVGAQKFYLDNTEYPLEGTIEVRSRCTTLPPIIEIDFRGFLTMYQLISGLGAWSRYWAVLRRGSVHFWKYPDDEAAEKPPLTSMDLAKCTDKRIVRAPSDICSRPHAFSVDLVLTDSPMMFEKKRVLLSADTKELCNAWIQALNDTLSVLRGQ